MTGPDPRDFLDLDVLLTEEERSLRETVRRFVDEAVLPEVAGWFEAGRFPTELIEEMAQLVEMMISVNRGVLLALHLARRNDEGALSPEQVSLGKLDNVRNALDTARTARSVLGANGITLEYLVIRHMNNLESVYTYEGTNEIHTLILGQSLTGMPAFGAS